MSIKELEIEIRARNNRLKERRGRLGLTQLNLAHEAGVSYSAVNRYENLRLSPISKEGRWRRDAKKLATFFGVEPAELFPEVVFQIVEPVATRKLDVEEVGLLSGYQARLLAGPDAHVAQQELYRQLTRLFDKLTLDEQEVLCCRFGLDGDEVRTLEQTGERLGLTRERVRRIECKALRTLRRPCYSKYLLEFW